MKARVVLATACVVAGSLIGGFDCATAFAANAAPVVTSGTVTVNYENVYTIHFTASDPEGAPLTVVTLPLNDDWISCNDGPANDFTCDYSSNRYYDPAPLPTAPFQRTISYSVSDGTTTSTGTWTVTVLPPPVMQIVGNPSVTEGGQATLKLQLSSNPYGSQLIRAHVIAVERADGDTVAAADLMIEVADGQTTVDINIPTVDDAIAEPTRHFSVSVNPTDAIPYRFASGGNLVTVLDNDGSAPRDTTPPTVSAHRNVIVERGGGRRALVPYTPPPSVDAVDGVVPTACTPAPMSAMPAGLTQVICSAADAAGNAASTTFNVTVHNTKFAGSVKVVGDGFHQCVTSGQQVWIEAEGYSPNAAVTVQLLPAGQSATLLVTVHADKKGRVRQFVTTPPAAAGDADVVLIGPAGDSDLVRMLPVKVTNARHQYGGHILGYLRNCGCN